MKLWTKRAAISYLLYNCRLGFMVTEPPRWWEMERVYHGGAGDSSVGISTICWTLLPVKTTSCLQRDAAVSNLDPPLNPASPLLIFTIYHLLFNVQISCKLNFRRKNNCCRQIFTSLAVKLLTVVVKNFVWLTRCYSHSNKKNCEKGLWILCSGFISFMKTMTHFFSFLRQDTDELTK